MATLVEDVFIRILYAIYPEFPMILLASKATQAIMPSDRKEAITCLSYSRLFQQHNREEFVAKIEGRHADNWTRSRDQIREVSSLYLRNHWDIWQHLMERIARPHGRDRMFYDNLAFWTFRHCVLTNKTHLLGGTIRGDVIGDFAEYSARLPGRYDRGYNETWWWPSSYQYTHEKGKSPSELATDEQTHIDYSFDVVAVNFRTFPLIYVGYRIGRGDYRSSISFAIFMKMPRKVDTPEWGETIVRLSLHPPCICFLDTTPQNTDRHLAGFVEYADKNSGEYSSMMEYKRQFTETELLRKDSPLLVALMGTCFFGHVKTTEALLQEITKVECIQQPHIYNALVGANKRPPYPSLCGHISATQ